MFSIAIPELLLDFQTGITIRNPQLLIPCDAGWAKFSSGYSINTIYKLFKAACVKSQCLYSKGYGMSYGKCRLKQDRLQIIL